MTVPPLAYYVQKEKQNKNGFTLDIFIGPLKSISGT